MHRLLILGGSGTLGQALMRVASAQGLEVLAPSHQELDALNRDALSQCMREFNPGAVANCVCLMGIDPCEKRPEQAYLYNSQIPLQLARLCEEAGCALIQPSSHAVFAGDKEGPYLESDPPRPTSVYGGTKHLAEVFASANCRRAYIVRLPTLFGPRKGGSPGFTEKMIVRLRQDMSVRVAEDKLDSPTYVNDAAGAILALLTEGRTAGLYHIANHGATNYYDFIHTIAAHLGATHLLSPALDRDFPSLAPKPLRTALASEKLPPLRSWREALGAYLESEAF